MDSDEAMLDDKKWDRVWTTEEIRKNSTNWTLAGDVGLYNLLQEFSQNLISRTHEVQNAVDSLVHNTKMASVKVSNVINDFHMLSNLQFVENRVYDEEVQEEVLETKPAEKTKEQREAEMLPKIVKAVELGIAVLDQAFNRINVNEISDSEDEDISSEGRVIFEPKNPYEHRPLPYIIGSEEFMADDYAGLKDLIIEDAESSVSSESSSSETDETTSDEEDLPLDDEKFSGIPTPRTNVPSISDRYSSSDESELFGAEKEDTGFMSDSSIDAKVKDEKINQKPLEETKVEVRDTRQSSISKLNLPQVLPVPKQPQKKKESEDLFASDDVSDDDSPFRKKTGLFSSDIRFDDDEKDIFESDLFGSQAKKTEKPAENPKTQPVQKKPPAAVQKTKEPDLFGDDEDSEDDIFNKLTKVRKPTLPKEPIVTKVESPDKADSSSTPSSAPSIKASGNAFDFMTGAGNSNSLFNDDDSDGDDLFSSKKSVMKKFDFAADDDNDDLFSLTVEDKPKKAEVSAQKKAESEKPALFDSASNKEKSYKKMGTPLPGLTNKKPKDSIFDDSDNSEQIEEKKSKIPPALTVPKEPKGPISLFDDDDDDEDDIFSQKPKLFSPGKSPSIKNKLDSPPAEISSTEDVKREINVEKKAAQPSLFDDFAEVPEQKKQSDTPTLFDSASSKEKSYKKMGMPLPGLVNKPNDSIFDDSDNSEQGKKTIPASKKPDASLFEESDSFDLFKASNVKKPQEPKFIQPKVVKESGKSLFGSPDKTDGSTSSKAKVTSSPVKIEESSEAQMGFDIPVDSSKTLNVINKDRAKIATKRRKPTRKGRLAAIESDTDTFSDSVSSPFTAPVTKNSIIESSDDLFSSEEPEPPVITKAALTHKTQEKKKMDLMSQLMSEAASSKVGKKVVAAKKQEEEDVVDIFAELDGKRDKSQSFTFKSPIENSSKATFVDDEETDEKEHDFLASMEDENDDFFTEPSFRKFSSSIAKKESISILDMDDDDDDLFSIKPSTLPQAKVDNAENDIFAESDIFADVPKEKYEMFPSQLYDDEDEDDIFGSMDQSGSKVEKSVPKASSTAAVKKVEKKPVFDDPLSGLLGDD